MCKLFIDKYALKCVPKILVSIILVSFGIVFFWATLYMAPSIPLNTGSDHVFAHVSALK